MGTVERYLAGAECEDLNADQRELVRRIAELYGVEPTEEAVELLARAVRASPFFAPTPV